MYCAKDIIKPFQRRFLAFHQLFQASSTFGKFALAFVGNHIALAFGLSSFIFHIVALFMIAEFDANKCSGTPVHSEVVCSQC